PRPLAGLPLGLAAILKLSPVVVIGYFAWRRSWGIVAASALTLLVLMLGSVTIAGWDNNVTFVRDVMPRLLKGSTFYDNSSLSGAVARAWFGRNYWYWEDEVPAWPAALRAG